MHEMTGHKVCPFYKYEKKAKNGDDILKCEYLTIRFPNKKSRRRYAYGFCANGGYCGRRECTWHRELMTFYEEEE